MPTIDLFGEFIGDSPEDFGEYARRTQIRQIDKNKRKKADNYNELGELPPITPEILEARLKYRNDYVQMHLDVFPASTGIKEFGQDQQRAIRRFQAIVQKGSGGKLVQAEPRGFAKTSRAINQILKAILDGDIKFALIVSSEITKATDIMDQLQTELMSNDKLTELYPGVLGAFQHIEGKAGKAKHQTYEGEPTHLGWSKELLIFPTIPGEVSSGARIMVRTKDNLRGISQKVKGGPDTGKVVRPDFILLDDIQTDKDAKSPTLTQTIVGTIKRSALFGGSHSKKVRVIMTITPNRRGDTASHFMLREPSWEVAHYAMVGKMPTSELWDQFGRILLNFDKYKEGDRLKAQRRASDFVRMNYEELHAGTEVSWDWAYEWDIDDPIEVSALHHAMVFYYEEGEEAFNYECQCKLDKDSDEDQELIAQVDTIAMCTTHFKQNQIPQECLHVVTHVDMNDEILTYVTMASSNRFHPYVIDYGTYPPQPTRSWRKKNLASTLQQLYPHIPRGNVGTMFYTAIKDFSKVVANTLYTREDGVKLQNRYIGWDAKYQTDDVIRGIRESEVRAFCIATQGMFFGHKDRPLMELVRNPDRELHFHCYTAPSSDKTVPVLRIDTNYIKTMVHRGFLLPQEIVGAVRLYHPGPDQDHYLLATHCNAEWPIQMVNLKEERVVVEWTQYEHRENEYFDNIVGCVALLFKIGCHLKEKYEPKVMDMQDYINAQKGYKT